MHKLMKNEENLTKVPFSSRLPAELRKDFEIQAKVRGIKFIEMALEQAVRLWLAFGENAVPVAEMLESPDDPNTEIVLKAVERWKKEQALKKQTTEVSSGGSKETARPRAVNDRRRGA